MNFIFPDPLGHLGWGQLHPSEMGNWLNISKTIEILTPKPYIHVPYVIRNVCNTLDMAPGVNPTPRNCIVEYLKNY